MTGLCPLPHGIGANDEPLRREAEIGLLCLSHRHQLTKTVLDVRDLWTDLAFIVEAGSAPKDETPRTRHLKSAEAPAPANLEVLSLRDSRSASARSRSDQSEPIPSVVAIVASWVLLVAEERPLSAALPAGTLAQLALLVRHHDWIAAQEWVDDYIGEMEALRKALVSTVRDQEFKRVATCDLPSENGRVPMLVIHRNRAQRIVLICGGDVLVRNGEDVWRCRSCRATWVTDQQKARFAIRNVG